MSGVLFRGQRRRPPGTTCFGAAPEWIAARATLRRIYPLPQGAKTGTHLRRRLARPRPLDHPAQGRQPRNAGDSRPEAEASDPVRSHGYRHRSPPGHRHGTARRHGHHPQESQPGTAGRGSGQGQEVRGRCHPRPDHRRPGNHHPRRAGPDPGAQHLRRAGGGQRRPAGRHRDPPRHALRDRAGRSGPPHHDQEGSPDHGQGRRRL
ncbi:hypothetical protein G6F22_017773 [Rhizopus arrhizus]|nr:hypothetical protein G6F22_017773 [Rhizopus arrhizus]